MTILIPVFKIRPSTQQYDWGKLGSNSKVALFASASSDIPVDESKPYAELWMGTHPSSPSHTLSSNTPLSSHLASNPSLIGDAVTHKFADQGADKGNLPFLFKVLSIHKALSIQTHPDKITAQHLHNSHPDIYKDSNHKPEMALAITPFIALCGFRPLPEIAHHLRTTPELSSLIPHSVSSSFLTIASNPNPDLGAANSSLKKLFAALMTADEDRIKEQLRALVKRYEHEGSAVDGVDQEVVQLVLRLHSQFEGDIGVFCAFVLNYVHLQPGEAIFLGAGEPHAYIAGECIECMANSDNVIRAGLTPKLRDIPNLIGGLTYDASPPSKHVVQPTHFQAYSTLYDPPVPEFSVVQLKLPPRSVETHGAVSGPSLGIVTEGRGRVGWGNEEKMELGMGDVFCVGAGTEVVFECEEEQMVVYKAFVEA